MSVEVARRMAQMGQSAVLIGQSHPEFVSDSILPQIADQFKETMLILGQHKAIDRHSAYSGQCSQWEGRKSCKLQGTRRMSSSSSTMRSLEYSNSQMDNKC